jgi:20S proteasome subunit beta 7
MRPVKPSFHPFTESQQPVQYTQNPKIVGTSILGMKYRDGIVVAADNLGSPALVQVAHRLLASFGSLARFKDVQRIFSVGDNTLIAYSGDVSDAQHIQFLLETLMFPAFPEQTNVCIGSVNLIIKMNIRLIH